MKNLGAAARFAIGCGLALLVVALFFAKEGGFDGGVSTWKQVAIVIGITLFGGLIFVLRNKATSAAFGAGRNARAKHDASDSS